MTARTMLRRRSRVVIGYASRALQAFAVVLAISVTAAAQAGAVLASVPAADADGGGQTAASGHAETRWQLAVGYQYNRISLLGVLPSFRTNGVNVAVARSFGNAIALESQVGAGLGTIPGGLSARSLFAGGGPRITDRGLRAFEPWIHGLVGIEHLNISNSDVFSGNTSIAWEVGGGLDYRFNAQFAARFEYDYLGTHFFSAFQRNTNIVAGVVWNF